MNWQPAYEGYVLKARRCCEDARAQLGRMGASERKGECVDDLLTSLKRVEVELSEIWERHYGPESEGAASK